jgi:hypothetical protein
MKMIWIYLALIFSINLSLFGQSITVFDVDTTNFPLMKAKIFVMDANGNQVTNLSPTDFILKENGVPRTVTNVSCPNNYPVKQISLALSINTTGVRKGGFKDTALGRLAITTSKSLTKLMSTNSEMAIQIHDYRNNILTDFTKNKSNLLSIIDSIKVNGSTNYVEQLLNPTTGLLSIAKTGKNKRVAIIMGNAYGFGLSDSDLQTCIDICYQYNIEFYTIFYTNEKTLSNGTKEQFKKLASATGGKFYDGITDYQKANEIAYLIQQKVQIGEYCEFEWQSSSFCENEIRKLDLTYLINNTSTLHYYTPDFNSISKLRFNLTEIHFKDVVKGVKRDTIITITAQNTDYNVSIISLDNPNFSISPNKFNLNSGSSIDLKLSYLPEDEDYNYCKFKFENSHCQSNMIAIGGNKKTIPKQKTLKLIYPNGNEFIFVGSKTDIKWEGVSKIDTIKIEYSLDSGNTWNLITNYATGLEYKWDNNKINESSKCLIKISQYSENGNPDSSPKVEWSESYGDNQDQSAFSIINTKDSNYLFVGTTRKLLKDINDRKYYDLWIVKINKTGKIIWSQIYGGSLDEYPKDIIDVNDGGFIISGITNSTDGIMTGNKESGNLFVMKIDSLGIIERVKFIGGSGGDFINSMVKTSDDGFIMTGYTYSSDGDVIGYDGELSDCWTIKFDSLENIEWQHTFGKNKHYTGESIIETFDKGFVIVGTTLSHFDSIVGNEFNYDVFMIKLDKFGKSQWFKSFGRSKNPENANSVIETHDGNLIISGCTTDSLNQKSGNLIIKMDPFGNIIWEKIIFIDSVPSIFTYNVIELENKDLLFGGYGYNYRISPCCMNFFIFKTDEFGNLIWNKSIGGSNHDYGFALIKSSYNGFIFIGSTESDDGDIIHPLGGRDAFVIKFSPDGITLQEDVSDSTFSIVTPSAKSRDIEMGDCLIGSDKDSLFTEFIHNTSEYKIRVDSIYFSGQDSSAFSFVPEFTSYEIEAGEYGICQIKFTPFKEAIHNAKFNIITQSDTLVQNISGTGYQPQIVIVSGFINFGEVELGNYKQIQDSTLIKNISNLPVKFNNIKQNDFGRSQFVVENSSDSFILQPKEERKISMQFKPQYGGRSTGQLEFNYEGKGSPAVAQLFGIGKGGSVKVSNDSARAGEKITLKLNLTDIKPENLTTLATNYEVVIRFQKTILAPENLSNVKIVNDSTYMTFNGKLVNSTEILSIPLIAGLGSVGETSIDIIEFNLTDNVGNKIDYNFEYESGIFHLLGICEEGGKRLINPNSNGELINISPNPNDGNLKVELNLIENGFTKLKIYSYSGQLVYEKQINSMTGNMEFDINIENLSNGIYFVNLQTPTINKILKLVVFR